MTNTKGVKRRANGIWEYRIVYYEDGKQRNKRGSRDELGNPFRKKSQAVAARKKALEEIEARLKHEKIITPKTYAEVFGEYQQKGRADKAKATIRKQDSLWDNHLKERFGDKYLHEVSVAEIKDYLSELYYVEGRAYSYTESFLKMFYLILGQGYARDYLDVDTYNKLCVNKNSKIRMPKKKVDDDDEIVTFSPEELEKLDDYFRGSNAETAYLLGRYTGVRIAECFGITWDDIDFEKELIRINKQMIYTDGIFTLAPVKTRNGVRTVYMSDKLKAHLMEKKKRIEEAETMQTKSRRQKETMIPHENGKEYSSLDFVNTLPRGKMQTINSIKYHAQQIKEKYGIHFKYHYLRHTFGTSMAEQNTPAYFLCKVLGHAKIDTTMEYYLGETDTAVEGFKKHLNMI